MSAPAQTNLTTQENSSNSNSNSNSNSLRDLYIRGMECIVWICGVIALAQALHCVTLLYDRRNAELREKVEKLADLLGVIYKDGKDYHLDALILAGTDLDSHIKVLTGTPTPKGTPKPKVKSNDPTIANKFNKNVNETKMVGDILKPSADREIQTARDSILGIPQLHLDISAKKFSFKAPRTIPPNLSRHEVVQISTRYDNFDGDPTVTGGRDIQFRVGNSKSRPTFEEASRDQGGRVFQFENAQGLLSMMLVSVENAIPNQVIRTQRTPRMKLPAGGCFITGGAVFTLNLKVMHESNIVQIPSDDKTIQTLLLGRPMSQSELAPFMSGTFDVAKFSLVRHYLEYSTAVERAICRLLESLNRTRTFPEVILKCYRPECFGIECVTRPHPSNARNRCRTCRIAEFCSLCGNNWHTGPCNATDEEMQAYFLANANHLKPCPHCNTSVEKNSGCNHMTCRCGTHFCWTCSQILPAHRVSEHYRGFDAYGPCAVRIPPVEDEFGPHGHH